jgi:hypothetical protein
MYSFGQTLFHAQPRRWAIFPSTAMMGADMGFLRGLGKWFWRFMVIYSFIVSIVLVIVLAVLLLLIFDIKRNIAQPLVGGLHSSFIGLNEATIDWTIPVRGEIPLDLNIPLQTQTIVTLSQDVPLTLEARITFNGELVPTTVFLSLPAGTELDVFLDLIVPVQTTVPVSLDVRAVIPLQATQLHDVATNLRLLFEPLAVGLYNLPEDFGEAIDLAGDVLAGDADLLDGPRGNAYLAQAWPGFSTAAGYGYDDLMAESVGLNQPVTTGIVPIGGIPALDQQLEERQYIYQAAQSPQEFNAQSSAQAVGEGIPPEYFNGMIWDVILAEVQAGSSASGQEDDLGIIAPEEEGTGGPIAPAPPPDETAGTGGSSGGPASGPTSTPADTEDFGIVVPTPSPGGG